MAQQQQQGSSDSSMDFLWILGFILAGIILTWWFGKVYITTGVFYTRIYEIHAIQFIFKYLQQAAQIVGFSLPDTGLDSWLLYIERNLGGSVEFSNIVALSTAVGSYIRYPLILLMLLGAGVVYSTGPGNKYRHIHSTKTLKQSEKVLWPQITPVVDLDLIKKKLDDPPWAIALSPMRFCKKHDLLNVEQTGGEYMATLKRGKAFRMLSLQLGQKWSGLKALPMHHKALFAIFAARINNDKKTAEALMDQISASAPAGSKPDFSGVDAVLRKHAGSKEVGKIVSLHGYVTTVLASMLVGARGVGVIATAEFIWLKPIDRRMWYMLNSVGRATAVPEICGAFAHWLAEKRLGLPLMVPMIDEAIKGLELSLTEVIYKPDDED